MRTSDRAALAVLACAATALTSAAPGPVRQSPPRFRAGVDAVKVDALVTRSGRPVGGLSAEDFELRDNGVPQAVRFVSVESIPVNLVFVLDVSGSVAGPRLQSLLAAGRAAVGALRGIDRAALVTFSHQVTERTALTADRTRLLDALAAVSAGGGTSLYDAAYSGLLLEAGGSSRTLALIFSDGLDTSSWLTAPAVVDAAMQSDGVVYAVTTEAVGSERAVDLLMRNPDRRWRPGELAHLAGIGAGEFLPAIAAATGGRLLHADDRDLADAFGSAVREFQNRYLLMYVPSGVDRPGWHTITLRVKDRSADVQARRGYWR
ncbi:MAG: VWA domain-containing protein [Betaproteobacteria bacterium]